MERMGMMNQMDVNPMRLVQKRTKKPTHERGAARGGRGGGLIITTKNTLVLSRFVCRKQLPRQLARQLELPK